MKNPLDIGCRYCHAKPGEPCHNKQTNQPLQHHPHPCRDTDTKTIIPLPTPPLDFEEELF